jgi:hypothetical protein
MEIRQICYDIFTFSTHNYWFSDFVHRPGILETRKHNVSEIGSVSILRSGWGEEPVQLGPLERAKSSILTWGRKPIKFPKRCVFLFLEYRKTNKVQKPTTAEYYTRTMNKVQKPTTAEYYTPSLEPFRIYLHFPFLWYTLLDTENAYIIFAHTHMKYIFVHMKIGQTYYICRRPTVKEQEHHWVLQQDFNQSNIYIIFNKIYFKS